MDLAREKYDDTRKILRKHDKMFSGQLRNIHATKMRIDFLPTWNRSIPLCTGPDPKRANLNEQKPKNTWRFAS